MTPKIPPGSPARSLLTPSPISLKFSKIITVNSTLFFLASVGVIMWSYMSLSPLDRVSSPEKSLERLTSRTLELEGAIKHLSQTEQSIYRLLGGNDNGLGQAISDYQELANYSTFPLVSLYLAVLLAEAGNERDLANLVNGWENQSAPFPLYRHFLQVGYVQDTSPYLDISWLQARLAEEIPDNWFYSRLAIQLAKKSKDQSFVKLTNQHVVEQIQPILWRSRLLLLSEIVVCLGGVTVILFVIRRSSYRRLKRLKICQGTLPPRWTGSDGFAVLVRGGALTTLSIFILSVMAVDSYLLVMATMIALYAPLLLLAYYFLLLPNDVTVARAFGLRIPTKRRVSFLLVTMILMGAGLLGDWIITIGLAANLNALHWTEWFDQHLVWGTGNELVLTVMAYVLIAPLFEELIFRGIVYATLRRRFGWGTSAVLSALLFSFVHGYGLVGLLSVFWSGLLWAWAYEKTGSLWPGIAAHIINNLVVSLSLLMTFR